MSHRTFPSTGTDADEGSLADLATFQLIVGWRERAWRNAGDLAAAVSDEERDLVAQRIEEEAAAEGLLLVDRTPTFLR